MDKSLPVLDITEPQPETMEERYNRFCKQIEKHYEHLKEPRFAAPQILEQQVLDLAEQHWRNLNKEIFGLKKENK